jgi:hypothetical protein
MQQKRTPHETHRRAVRGVAKGADCILFIVS